MVADPTQDDNLVYDLVTVVVEMKGTSWSTLFVPANVGAPKPQTRR
jgi:hypothetical protein